MTNSEKKIKLQKLLDSKSLNEMSYYKYLEETNDIKRNYHEYMSTGSINTDFELKKVTNADYELCTALLTMLLREDHFCNGSFEKRYNDGEISLIIKRMIELLEMKTEEEYIN